MNMELWHNNSIHEHYMLISIGASILFFVIIYIGYKFFKNK
jgi:hypothetical protein